MKELFEDVEYGNKGDMEFLSIKTDLGQVTFARHPRRKTSSCTIRKEDFKWHILESCIGAKRPVDRVSGMSPNGRRVKKVTIRQACPECENGEGLVGVDTVVRVGSTVECWRCDDHGLVEPYDATEPTIKVLHSEQC